MQIAPTTVRKAGEYFDLEGIELISEASCEYDCGYAHIHTTETISDSRNRKPASAEPQAVASNPSFQHFTTKNTKGNSC